jgi:polyphosphate kinase 2 (PPK2 family)
MSLGVEYAAPMGRLDDVDLSKRLKTKEYEERLTAAQARVELLRLVAGGKVPPDGPLGPGVCVLVEGWDAGGKGGAIKRLVARMDPRHVRYAPFSAPSYDEKRHHWLLRFAPAIPGRGGMSVLDRSWYGRVLVERVEGFASDEEWGRAYEEIVGFERSLAMEGLLLIKIWLHISEEEQLKRFQKREKDPLKAWKLTDEDWRNRARRRDYCDAVEDMFKRTDHEACTWHVLPGDQKKYARVAVIETVSDALEAALKHEGIPIPDVA